MAGLRLLERLQRQHQGDDSRVSNAELLASVRRHLDELLNTMQGSCLIAPDLGLADMQSLSWHFSEETHQDLARSITLLIQHFEPRLHDVRIQALPAQQYYQLLQLKIEAELETDGHSMRVVLNTEIEPDGNIIIK